MAKMYELLRQSGNPVQPEAQAAYAQEWQLAYDEIELRAEKIYAKKTGKLQLKPKMLFVQRMCSAIERKLFKKHNVRVDIPLPKSAKAWAALVKKYEAPILCAQRQDSGELILVIMDTLGQ